MYLNLIFLPLLSSITAGIFGKKLGSKGSCLTSIICIFLTFIISLVVFYEVGLSKCSVYLKLAPWINSEILHVNWGFVFDSLTAIMCCVICFISFIVHLYSSEYMCHDPHLPRFMSFLSLFTFFMLILVTADNFVQMFVGWEGVGLCSYLLINFWHTRIQANKAAIKAMIINRIGDLSLTLGILTIFSKYKAVDYATVFSLTPFFVDEKTIFFNMEFNLLDLIGFLLFIGAIGKSAQLGLHVWLPDAMEGPTPVSALIHAATMVTAGIFLIVRCSPIFEYTPITLKYITLIGGCTVFFGSTVAIFQNDIKKIIAYSTCSQLGYMIFACGLSDYSLAVFHLINHAFFKALLFLGAGSVIHSVSNEQDIRKMGGLKRLIPFTYSSMLIGSFALMGFPFLAGFYSKEAILECAYGSFTKQGHFCFMIGSFSAFLTAFYSTRLVYLTFLSRPNGYKYIICSAYDSSYAVCISLILLVFPSIFVGYFLKDMLIGLGTDFWGSSIYIIPQNLHRIDADFVDSMLKLFPIIITFSGIIVSFILYNSTKIFLFKIKISRFGVILYNFMNKKWFFDKVYVEFIAQTFFKFGYSVSYKVFDKGFFETLGPKGFSLIAAKMSLSLRSYQSGILYHYAFMLLVGSTFMIGVRQFWYFLSDIIDYKLFAVFIVASLFFKNNTTSKSS